MLGAGVPPEVIHRDDLTILPAARQADARKKGDKPS
jgi:hypothetical protein